MSPAVPVGLLLTQSDERLAGYARAGHERAFEALVRRYRRQLFGYCRRLLLSEEHAEDALQQALLQAWVALREGTEVRAVRPWLYRIVYNAAVNALRASGYDYCQLSESLIGAGAPEEDLDRRIAVREALAGLASLPELQRQALLRTAVEGASHEQAAGELGVSEPAVRGLVYRARTSLRAAASALVPPPLLEWALQAAPSGAPVLGRLGAVAGEGGAAGLVGLLLKGGAVAITAGALAGGIVAGHHRDGHAHTRPGRGAATAAGRIAPASDSGSPGAAPVLARPADFAATGTRAGQGALPPVQAAGQGQGRPTGGGVWSGGNGSRVPGTGRVEQGTARPRRQSSPQNRLAAAPGATSVLSPTGRTTATARDGREGQATGAGQESASWRAPAEQSGGREQGAGGGSGAGDGAGAAGSAGASDGGGGGHGESTTGSSGYGSGSGSTSVEGGGGSSRAGADDGAQSGQDRTFDDSVQRSGERQTSAASQPSASD